MCLTGFALVSSGGRPTAFHEALDRVPHRSGQRDPRRQLEVARRAAASCTACSACTPVATSSGSDHTARQRDADARRPATAIGHVRCGRRVSHSSNAAIATKIATTMCDMIASAISSAGSQRRLPGVERVRERAEPEQRERQPDRERELARERARDVAAVDLPVGAGLHERAERGDRERGRRGPGRLHALGERSTPRPGACSGPLTVTSLNATLYGITTLSSPDHQRRDREVVLPDREARVPVGRPAREPELREPVVDRGTWATTRGRPCRRRWSVVLRKRSPNRKLAGIERPVVRRVDDAEHQPGADRDDRPADRPLPERARLIVLVERRREPGTGAARATVVSDPDPSEFPSWEQPPQAKDARPRPGAGLTPASRSTCGGVRKTG